MPRRLCAVCDVPSDCKCPEWQGVDQEVDGLLSQRDRADYALVVGTVVLVVASILWLVANSV